MARHLRRHGHAVGRKRVRRLMARMGLAAVYQRPRTTARHPQHRVWPYLLRGLVMIVDVTPVSHPAITRVLG
jgi:putative transposase